MCSGEVLSGTVPTKRVLPAVPHVAHDVQPVVEAASGKVMNALITAYITTGVAVS
jgi:hypothetical protein